MLREFCTAVTDILLPKNCHICSKILKGRTNAFDDNLCLECVRTMRPTGTDGSITACYAYEGATRELVHKFKYGNRPYLSKSILRLMSLCLNPALFQEIDYLVPIPLHAARAREREFNQSELIARELSSLLNKPATRALKRTRNTAPQTSFASNERFENIKGAFAVFSAEAVMDKNILLIDDVVTTTATTAEAALVLKQAGANKICVLAFAKG